MREGEISRPRFEMQRLSVLKRVSSCCRIPDMSDRVMSFQIRQCLFRKDFRYESLPAVREEVVTVTRDDACPFLSPVLQAMQAVIGELRCIRLSEDPEDATLLI